MRLKMTSAFLNARTLLSSAAQFNDKLEAAQQLLELLTPTGIAHGDCSMLPEVVKAHYLRSLLDWTIGTVTKGGAAVGKQAQQQKATQESRLRPALWALLVVLLRSDAVGQSNPLPASLLPAATSALTALRSDGVAASAGSGASPQLLSYVSQLLHALGTKFQATYKPGLELVVAAAEAALLGLSQSQEGSSPAWAEAVAATATLLLAFAQAPSQRKVWDAVVPRLAVPLIAAAFPADAQTAASGATEVGGSCRRVLQELVFHQAHIAALAEACAPSPEPPTAAGVAHRTYVVRVFELLGDQVNALASGPTPSGEATLRSLPWLVEQCCAALGTHRRAAEVAEALTLRDGGRLWEQPAGGAEGEGTGVGGISKSADFHFYSAMLRLVLGQLADAMGGRKPAANEQTVERLLRAVAGLTATLKQQHIYRATEDPGGAQRQRLAEVANLAVAAPAAAPRGQPEFQQWEGVVGAALEVLRSILAVEHRVVQEHLPAVWPMLWVGSGVGGVAAQVACALVEAYSELRQLDVLLSSLVDAVCAAPAAHSAPAVGDVVCGGAFLGALQRAVRRLPSGQVSGIVRLVATWIPLLQLGEAAASSSPVGLVLTDMSVACLDSLDVGIVTASAVAEATEALVTSSLAQPLLQQLHDADRRSAAGLPVSALAGGLHLYSAALRLHAHCCALHPQVMPLPGQSTHPGAGAAGNYFSALSAAARPPELMPVVLAALRFNAAEDGSAAMLHAALVAAAQRLRTLHLRHAYWEHRCGEQDGLSSADVECMESELAGLATALADAVSQPAPAAGSYHRRAGPTPLATLTLQRLQAATANLVVAHLPEIQAWVPKPALASLLHVALGNAPGPLCEVLEMEGLRAAMPSATSSQLHKTLSDLLGGADGKPPAKKNKTKCSAGSADGVSALSGIMQHLERLSKGKAVKQDAWATDLQACCTALAAAADDHVAARSAASAKSKKRKARAATAEVDVGSLGDLLHTLSRLELSCMPPESAHALLVAGMVTALTVLQVAISADAHDAASTFLGVAASALEVVACAALDTGLGSVGRGPLLLAQSVPSFTAAVQAAASALLPDGRIGAAERGTLDAIACGCRDLTQAYCAASLNSLAESSVEAQLGAAMQQALRGFSGSPLSRWVSASFVEACLAACRAAAGRSTGSGSKRQAGIVSGGSPRNAAASPNLPLLTSLTTEAEMALPTIAAGAGSAGACDWQRQLLLGSVAASRAHTLHIRCSGGGSADAMPQPSRSPVISGMPEDVQALAAVLAEEGGSLPTTTALQLISYLEAACSVVQHIKPAASAAHFATLLALVLHLLQALPPPPTGLDPARHTLPFVALFPAATAAAGGAVRAALLMALRALLDGSSNQQLSHALRLAESALVAPGGSGAGAYSLPLAELALMALEGCSGGGAVRTLGQHADRVCAALAAFVAGAACPIGGRSEAGPASFAALMEAAAAAAPAAPAAVEAVQPPPPPPPQRQDWAVAAQRAGQRPETSSAEACTALRAMESIAARPRQFELSQRRLCHILQSVLATWARPDANEEQSGVAHTPALFCGSCHLLTAVLRHRQLEVGRCLPVVVQALRALLAAMVSWEVAAKLASSGSISTPLPGRVCCAEMLAKVLTEVASLKNASKYCPHLLADYLILAASPLSAKSRAVLGLADIGRSSSDALGSGLLSLETSAALRQGAYALYGACSAAEVQYLYATLGGGGRGGGSGAWRAALTALRADHDKHFKYTGKV